MEEQQRSGFWSTLPGILTGSAALITAATGGYLAFDRSAGNPASASPLQMQAPAESKPVAAVDSKPAESAASEVHATIVDPGGSANLPSAPPSQIATGEPKPSFNCALAATAVENMLCSDAGLADRDRRVAAQYFTLRGTLPANVRSQLLQSQRQFLEQRSGCSTSQCLSDLYDNRLRRLAEFASN
jgi:hypothetical protein